MAAGRCREVLEGAWFWVSWVSLFYMFGQWGGGRSGDCRKTGAGAQGTAGMTSAELGTWGSGRQHERGKVLARLPCLRLLVLHQWTPMVCACTRADVAGCMHCDMVLVRARYCKIWFASGPAGRRFVAGALCRMTQLWCLRHGERPSDCEPRGAG